MLAHWIWYIIYIWLNWNSNGMIYQSVARKFDVRVSVNMLWLKDSSVAQLIWGKLWSSLAVVRMAKVEACSLTTSHNHGVRFSPRSGPVSPNTYQFPYRSNLSFEIWGISKLVNDLYFTSDLLDATYRVTCFACFFETPIISAQTWGSTDG